MDLLPISPAHLDALKPLSFHHRDPFDRLIIAQSIVENVPILSRDINLTYIRLNEDGRLDSSLISQGIYGIGASYFPRLITYRGQGDKQRQKTTQYKRPYLQINAIGKIL